ncbi:unnamed protein product [Bursaphelenchus xylophilus]|uniref:(pine wood nematode) hypothetical protein n=1 Tax=Bursaphelenchus xylophilus TaxID=6326 RepID=A0A1I7SL23_BURXY|nr:unnamed protein product [Bursaphelenchus xylophilus]CAG9129341.1 unnamed protein product [Bursaphelenchus xylophilus]
MAVDGVIKIPSLAKLCDDFDGTMVSPVKSQLHKLSDLCVVDITGRKTDCTLAFPVEMGFIATDLVTKDEKKMVDKRLGRHARGFKRCYVRIFDSTVMQIFMF